MLHFLFLCFLSLACSNKEQTSSKQDSLLEKPSSDTRKKRIEEHNQALFDMDRRREERQRENGRSQHSSDVSEITLMDGSILKGELFDIEQGHYQIRSSTLGVLSIPMDNVLKIQRLGVSEKNMASNLQTTSPVSETTELNTTLAQIESLKQSLIADPETIIGLSQLQSNNNIMNIIQDPEVMSLIQQGDLEALQQHPKMQSLMTDPSIIDLLGIISP